MNSPIKRSPELITLSRDHHDGLLLCWKIRTGLKKEIATDRIAAYLVYFFEHDLKDHFRTEEEILFPLLPVDDAMVEEAITQHELLNQLADQIRKGDAAMNELLLLFANELDNHIRFEERKLFPHIEQDARREDLVAAGRKILELSQHHVPLNWEDEFWLK
jgi:iron-sulfur cluster repair protein YtfE (RIC family)